MERQRETLADRMQKYTDKSDIGGCWLWTGSKNSKGYGKIFAGTPDKRLLGAHRVAYELAFGLIPDGTYVLHKCDVPACVNPEHLFLGTQKDNMQDCKQKGRHQNPCFYGEGHPNAKLTWAKVGEIRDLAGSGKHTNRDLSDRFGVSSRQIGQVVNRRQWVDA